MFRCQIVRENDKTKRLANDQVAQSDTSGWARDLQRERWLLASRSHVASCLAVLSSDLHGYILNGAARSQLHSLWACGMRYVWHSIQFGTQSPRRNSLSLWPNPLMQQRFVGEICSFKLTAYVWWYLEIYLYMLCNICCC